MLPKCTLDLRPFRGDLAALTPQNDGIPWPHRESLLVWVLPYGKYPNNKKIIDNSKFEMQI
jgi:hypothetical protein